MIFFSKRIPSKKFHINHMSNKHIMECEILDRQIFLSNSSRTDFSKELKKTNTEYFIISMEEKNDKFLYSCLKFFFRLLPYYKTNFKIVGYIGLWYILEEAHIVSIGIDQDYRNCGLGEFLMIGAIDSAINRNVELVTLEVRISNYSAKKLYSKFGFNEVGIRKNYYFDNREDALIMTTNSILNSNYQEEFYKIYQTQLKIYKESS
ncbi:MAG: ribosomal protein S18-alanine N-acetyltransferase [Dehalococcoidia bacterium]